jgi:hypothetical protein
VRTELATLLSADVACLAHRDRPRVGGSVRRALAGQRSYAFESVEPIEDCRDGGHRLRGLVDAVEYERVLLRMPQRQNLAESLTAVPAPLGFTVARFVKRPGSPP